MPLNTMRMRTFPPAHLFVLPDLDLAYIDTYILATVAPLLTRDRRPPVETFTSISECARIRSE